VPDGDVEALEALAVQRRQLGQRRGGQRLERGDGKGLDLARLDLAGGVRGLVAHDVHLAAEQVVHAGAVPL
jgi:hypothetical protein